MHLRGLSISNELTKELPTEEGSLKCPKCDWGGPGATQQALLMHYGMTQHDYYTVMFGVSRAFGVMPAQVWSRALGLPIERPNSFDLENLRTVAEAAAKK